MNYLANTERLDLTQEKVGPANNESIRQRSGVLGDPIRIVDKRRVRSVQKGSSWGAWGASPASKPDRLNHMQVPESLEDVWFDSFNKFLCARKREG